MTHEELIIKLIVAKTGSRELDAHVDALVRGRILIRVEQGACMFEHAGRYAYEGPAASIHGEPTKPFADPAKLTTSVDAALTLIPAGWFLIGLSEARTPVVALGDHHEPLGRWDAHLQYVRGGGRLTSGVGKTPALAIVVAALRVRGERE